MNADKPTADTKRAAKRAAKAAATSATSSTRSTADQSLPDLLIARIKQGFYAPGQRLLDGSL